MSSFGSSTKDPGIETQGTAGYEVGGGEPIKDTPTLLKNLNPKFFATSEKKEERPDNDSSLYGRYYLDDDQYVFGSFSWKSYKTHKGVIEENALAIFKEKEGCSILIPNYYFDENYAIFQQLEFEKDSNLYRCIVLDVNSSLEAVGLTAKVSVRLTELNIPCNVIAAFHHDYIIIPENVADRALTALKGLQEDSNCSAIK